MCTNKDDINWAMQKASRDRDFETVKYLVEEKGADPSAGNNYAIHWASVNGDLELVKYLIEKGGDIKTDNNRTLRETIQNGHLHILKYLVKIGLISREDIIHNDLFGNRHFEMVKYIVESAPDFSAHYPSVIMYACREGHFDIVEYLVDDLFNKNLQHIIEPHRPAYNACRHGHINIVKYLVKKYGIESMNRLGLHPINGAIVIGNLEIVKYLVEQGANIMMDDTAVRQANMMINDNVAHSDRKEYVKILEYLQTEGRRICEFYCLQRRVKELLPLVEKIKLLKSEVLVLSKRVKQLRDQFYSYIYTK